MQRQQRIQRPQNSQYSKKHSQRDEGAKFDIYNVFKYVIITAVLSLIAFGVKKLVMMGISLSPTGKVGNGMLTLYEVHNTGAAFNLFAGQQEMIITASFFAVAIIAFVLLITSAKQSGSAVSAMAALSSGIIMNMLERINQGYVVDYIHCEFAPNFPVFNVPDIYIFVGAVCLILSVLTKR